MFKVTYQRRLVFQPENGNWENRERVFNTEVEAKFFAENLISDEMILYKDVDIRHKKQRRQYENYYLKDSPIPLISGIQLPKDSDGVVRNVDFIGCHFHANCTYLTFEGCTFVECSGYFPGNC